VRQRERAVAAQRPALRACIERDDVDAVAGERQRERRADGAGADDADVRCQKSDVRCQSTTVAAYGNSGAPEMHPRRSHEPLLTSDI
jgi:hypothetical protein